MREILHLKGTPRGEASRIKVEEKPLPYEHKDKEYKMEHFEPNYSPAKQVKRAPIQKQKKREFYKK